MNPRIVLTGLNVVLKAYERRAKQSVARTIVNKAGLMVKGQAVELAPVDTGALSQSIDLEPAKESKGTITARVYTDKEYAPYVEFGTGVRGAASSAHQPKSGAISYGDRAGQIAQPFLHPAVELTKPKINKLAAQEIKKSMR